MPYSTNRLEENNSEEEEIVNKHVLAVYTQNRLLSGLGSLIICFKTKLQPSFMRIPKKKII